MDGHTSAWLVPLWFRPAELEFSGSFLDDPLQPLGEAVRMAMGLSIMAVGFLDHHLLARRLPPPPREEGA